MPDRRFVLVVNDKAGGARARKRLEHLRSANPPFADASLVAPFTSLDDVREALARAPERVPVAAGGDGTVNLVARVAREFSAGVPRIGVIPMGTGNLVAHELGIRNTDEAVATLLQGHPRPFDVMATTREDFPISLMSISTGFEADFIRTYDLWRHRAGRPFGVGAGLLRFLGPPSRNSRIDLDGEPFLAPSTSFWNAGLYSMKSFAFGIEALPDAIPDDGRGEGVLDPGRLRYGWGVTRGRHYPGPHEGADRYRRWRHARLEVAGAVQIDGEAVPGGAFAVTVVHRGLELLTPPGIVP